MNLFQSISCGIVFNASDFVYMESSSGEVSCIEWGLFADPGSLDYIFNKILSVNLPHIRIFDRALKEAVASIPLEPISVTSLLGNGRFGNVYSCVDKNGTKCAIKLIQLNEYISLEDVRKEHAKLTAVYSVAPDLTLKTRGDLMHFRDVDSDIEICAYIIEGVGSTAKNRDAARVGKALCNLHAVGIIHGDPRLENVIILDNELRWIDFRGNLDFA